MTAPGKARRVLIVLPNWVGDAVMATPALRLIRRALPGALVCGLCKPGIDDILAGIDSLDQLLPSRAGGVMGTKRTAQAIRPHRFDTALLLTNSFSTALAMRLAGIPRRIGFDRDGRGVLLTDRLEPVRRREREPFARSTTDPQAWAPVPAVEYYLQLAQRLVGSEAVGGGTLRLELAITERDRAQGQNVLRRAGVTPAELERGIAILNPGGNDEAKRWPAERFGALAQHLAKAHGWTILINGSPGEAELAQRVAHAAGSARCISLPTFGMTLGALKAIVARSALMVTNDTGPRHIAGAFGVPTVSLFGPTDHRWTTIPHPREVRVLADPTLPEEEVANDHPERCRMDRIEVEKVAEACTTAITSTARSD